MNETYYNKKFYKKSYAYQKNKNVNLGIKALSNEIYSDKRKFYIKTHFKNYFNTIDKTILHTKLREFFKREDYPLVDSIMYLLNRDVIYNNKVIQEDNGVMAGTPLSGYLANVFMNKTDHELGKLKNIYYIRYADDVLILTNDNLDIDIIESKTKPLDIVLNKGKTKTGVIKDGLTMLGFYFEKNIVDIEKDKIDKMKTRIKRRSIWFRKWAKDNGVNNRVMVKTFVKGMNEKFYSRDEEDRMNWSRWYFSSINTDRSLKIVDDYMIQYIRYLVSGKHLGYKKHSEVTYDLIKELGYVPLVRMYWKYKKGGLVL